MSDIKLKPCPFCGSEAKVYIDNGVQIVCGSVHCGARTPCLTDKEFLPKESRALELAISIWNARAKDDIK